MSQFLDSKLFNVYEKEEIMQFTAFYLNDAKNGSM